ncbi:metallophosphoesterase, partial [Enterococcus hirae]
ALITLLCLPIIFLKGQPADPYPPGKAPDRIILTWSDDPATTQSVTWRTDVSIKEGFAEIAPASASPDFREQTDTIAAAT